MTADRYLRTGTDVPCIYPGTMRWLSQAMKDAQAASERAPGQHILLGVRDGTAYTLQVYQEGTCTWINRRTER